MEVRFGQGEPVPPQFIGVVLVGFQQQPYNRSQPLPFMADG
jgi:hypothetical protein